MISDVLAGLAILRREVGEIDDYDAAVDSVVNELDRDLTDSEREQLDDMLPEWFEGKEVSADGD